MLCLDSECGGLILGHIVDIPEAVQDVQAEIFAENLLNQLAVAPAGSGRLDLDGPENAFI